MKITILTHFNCITGMSSFLMSYTAYICKNMTNGLKAVSYVNMSAIKFNLTYYKHYLKCVKINGAKIILLKNI